MSLWRLCMVIIPPFARSHSAVETRHSLHADDQRDRGGTKQGDDTIYSRLYRIRTSYTSYLSSRQTRHLFLSRSALGPIEC